MPKLNNYCFDNKIIARGFSSIVYSGIDTITNEKVAIKCIDQSVLDDPSKKKMLTNELNIQWELKQEPYIVEIKAQFYQDQNIYIVTQFCEYGDLKSKIKEKGKFVEPKAVSYIIDIIRGFETLFKHRIVHRDLKPSNILVSKKGTKIGDFGFAYKIVANQKAEEINAPSAGSPLYMAPEVLEDGKNSSHLSDIWSLGVIFYEMLTGRLPFPAKNKEALIKLIDRIGIRTIIPEHLSLRSKQFLLRTLKKDPQKRMTPEELLAFQFDDEILFKIKQHRIKKAEHKKMKEQMGMASTSSQERISSEQKCSEKQIDKKKSPIRLQKSEFQKNTHERNIHTHQNSKQHEPQKPSSKHHSSINPEMLKKTISAASEPLKNQTSFDQFDHNVHNGKNLLDPHDIKVKRFKRKSAQKQTIINMLQIHPPVQQKSIKHGDSTHFVEDLKNQKYLIENKEKRQKQSHHKHDIKAQHNHSNHKQGQKHVQKVVIGSKQGYKHVSEFTKEVNKAISHFEQVQSHFKVHTEKVHDKEKNHHEIQDKTLSMTAETKNPHKLKRGDSIMSVESNGGEQHHFMKKEQIIEILLNQIDMIRFLSRILHKIQEIHHLHVSQCHNDGHGLSPHRHSSHSKDSRDGHSISSKSQAPLIYLLLKQLIYRTTLQVEKLQFLPDEQAYKFFRSEEFDQIKIILDTYKTKLELVAVKAMEWKGMNLFQHELDKEIIIVYTRIKQKIKKYRELHLESESRQLKKLGRKIEALNYFLVLRFDYLILQREEVFMNDLSDKSGKHHEQCSRIRAIIQDKHSKQHEVFKTLAEYQSEIRMIQKKLKQITLV